VAGWQCRCASSAMLTLTSASHAHSDATQHMATPSDDALP
jgi:hypothetical protein